MGRGKAKPKVVKQHSENMVTAEFAYNLATAFRDNKPVLTEDQLIKKVEDYTEWDPNHSNFSIFCEGFKLAGGVIIKS